MAETKTDGRANNGGKGKVGAKKLAPEDKCVPVAFYEKQSVVDAAGGITEARNIAKNGFYKELERITKNRSKKN